jgi:hypothetical protein
MLTDAQIDSAKARTIYTHGQPLHEHNDCIRFAYEWLDAQRKIKGLTKKSFAIKHLIERWAGRYVSTSDVEVAAVLHSEIKGTYPYFNISARLTNPSKHRISHLGQAFTHDYHDRDNQKTYTYTE